MTRIILITGLPGVGKTTLVRTVVEKLRQNAVKSLVIRGFITDEIRDETTAKRTGFQVVNLSSDSQHSNAVLAKLTEKSVKSQRVDLPKVGKYTVYYHVSEICSFL